MSEDRLRGQAQRTAGTRLSRMLIHAVTLGIALLLYWLLGFVVADIERIEGPDYDRIEAALLDPALVERQEQLQQTLADLQLQIGNLREQRELVGSSAQNLQQTVQQLGQLQGQGSAGAAAAAGGADATLQLSLQHYLRAQDDYQQLNRQLGELALQRQQLDDELRRLDAAIEGPRQAAQQRYTQLLQRHHYLLAALQLAIVLPLLLLAAWLWRRQRRALHFPLILALSAASLIKAVEVIHSYFPSRLFNYLLIVGVLMLAVLALLRLLRAVARPRLSVILKQYREAYERFLCPACSYPIRTGPRRFLYWTRGNLHKVALPATDSAAGEEVCSCPACGLQLFEPCAHCGKVRHAQLEYCSHCGAFKAVGGDAPQPVAD